MEKEVFQLYKERTLGEKINDTFGFLRDNWRPVGQWFVYLMLPLSMVAAVPVQNMLAASMRQTITGGSMSAEELLMQKFGSQVGMLLTLFCTSLILTMVQLYLRREQRLEHLSASDVLQPLLSTAGALFLMSLAMAVTLIPIVLVMALLAVLFNEMLGTGFTVLLLIMMMVVLLPMMMMCMPVYAFERKEGVGVFAAILKGFKLGWNTLGGLLGLMVVMGFIILALSAILQGPAVGIWMVDFFKAYSSGTVGASPSILTSFWNYLLSVFILAGGQLCGMIWTLSLVLHYGHAREKIEGVAVDNEIESCDKL